MQLSICYIMCTVQLMLNEEKHLIFKGKWSDLSKRLHLHPNNWDVKRSSVIFLPIGTKSEAFSRDFLTNVNVAAHRWTHTHTHLWSNDSSVLPVNGTSMSLICSDGSFLLTEKPNKPQKCFVPWHPFFYSFKSALQNKLTVTPDGLLMDWASI